MSRSSYFWPMIIFKQFTFDSAHSLPNVPDGHKCKGVHGHTYHLKLFVEGELQKDLEWVMDFTDIKDAVVPVIKEIDHKFMNDLPGLGNPTCENIARWLWDKIKPRLAQMTRIELNETPTTGVIYEG